MLSRRVALAAAFAGLLPAPHARAEPIAFAYPAMEGSEPDVLETGLLYVPAFPGSSLKGGAARVTSPRQGAALLGFGMASHWGGGLGVHPSLTVLGVDLGGGVTRHDFIASDQRYRGGVGLWWDVQLPSPGVAWHRTGVLVEAQLVPQLLWANTFADDAAGDELSGSRFLFVGSAQIQACLEYNLGGVMPRNGAACVYGAPVIYADGWFNGYSFGIRGTLF